MKSKMIIGVCAALFFSGLISSIGNPVAKKLAASDKYKVIRVDGKIVFQRTKAEMKKGDIFLSGTQLDFKTPASRAAVISSLKGRFVLSAAEKGQTKILPAANNISSRSGALLNMIDLKNHFSGNYLILEKLNLKVGEKQFPLNESNFFYLSYLYNSEKINKKLPFTENNEVVFNESEIFKVDGSSIPKLQTEMALYYMNEEGATQINEFKPVFPDLTELKEEVRIILEEFESKPDEELKKEVTAYLDQFYGKPNAENLDKWLRKEFDIK